MQKISFSKKKYISEMLKHQVWLKSWSPGKVWGNDVGVNVFVVKSREKNKCSLLNHSLYFLLHFVSMWLLKCSVKLYQSIWFKIIIVLWLKYWDCELQITSFNAPCVQLFFIEYCVNFVKRFFIFKL